MARDLLPEEKRRDYRKRGVALGDAVEVSYLDHGERCKSCAFCNARLYEWEVMKKKKGSIIGGKLCCHENKATFLSRHFDEPTPEPLRSLFDDYTSSQGKLFHKHIRYINAALQMAPPPATPT